MEARRHSRSTWLARVLALSVLALGASFASPRTLMNVAIFVFGVSMALVGLHLLGEPPRHRSA